ncbi:MAG: UDP-N-acetylmuramoyl-tripeptide--D-alanyl-D-alanine ligase [Andreesenia angusta]|nr:UDP-N-acetylmuramoyl-tripeptide--D-alanyl-D-alanine ligase [Andreesenia angusta]
MNLIIALVLALTTLAACIYNLYSRNRYLIHMLQLEGYRNNNFSKWLKEFKHRAYNRNLLIGIGISIIVMILSILIFNRFEQNNIIIYLSIIIWDILIALSGITKKENFKVKLKITDRVKRLIRTDIIVNTVSGLLIILFMAILYNFFNILLANTIFIGFILASILIYYQTKILLLTNSINKPIEEKINRKYFVEAQNKIRSIDGLNIVGITGSYGKTSTKFLTATILEEKFKTLKTPESYNTPMGVSLVINRDLDPSYEVFVAEMGARNIGDIEEMVDLVGNKIGIITSVGPAHLETFKNIENIKNTKYEIVKGLPEDGIAVFNYDNKYVKELSDRTEGIQKINYGIKEDSVDIYAKDIVVGPEGSEFILGVRGGEEIKCSTRLLGEHNILNILAGASAGIALGMGLQEIAKGISKIEAVPHRLQLINPGTGVIIIDDAFNSNPDGARAALNVLSKFKEGRKIIITPGMIELGESEFEENKEFGRNIAKVCDYAILVGEDRAIPIKEGIDEMGFDSNSIFIVKSLDEATKILPNLTRPKDIVLFENDLPDNYNK